MAFTPIDAGKLKSSLAVKLTGVTNSIRDLRTRFGTVTHNVALVWVAWSGERRGQGAATVKLRIDILPVPVVTKGLASKVDSGGEREEGTIRVKDINATMAFSLLTGIEPNESESLPNVEFFYEVTEYTPAGEGITRRFTPGKPPEYTAAPPGWSVTLVRSYDDPDADHNSRE